MRHFKQANAAAEKGGIVIFGSTYFSGIPFGELARDCEIGLPVYNRSVAGMKITESDGEIEDCVTALSPSMVFISIGEEDVDDADFSLERFIESYRWLLYTIHNRCETKIYIVSVLSSNPAAAALNSRLEVLARETGCRFVNAVNALRSDKPDLRVFSALRPFMRNHNITFCEAMRAL